MTAGNGEGAAIGVRGILGAAALAITVAAAGSAAAVPVWPGGSGGYEESVVLSEVTGHSGGTVRFPGHELYLQDNRIHGGGAIYANSWSSYYFPGAASVAVGTATWHLSFDAYTKPLDLYMDWDIQYIVGASAILGAAGGGGELEVWVYQYRPSFPFPFPFPVGHLKEVYTDSAVDSDLTLLAHLNPDYDWFMDVKFQAGSATSTMSVVGIAAEADTFGFLGFELWADDGTSPPMPVPAPGALVLLAGALPLLGLAARRREARPVEAR